MSTEQKYPEHLVETVAKALFAGYGANGYHLDAHYRIEAVKVLDALGLTVTEEFGLKFDPTDISWGYTEDTARRWAASGVGRGYLRRTVLRAEVPWVEVASDGTE